METATEKTQGKNGAGNPKVANVKEVSAMRFGERIFKVKAPVKILAGLAAGAMLIGGTAFIYQEINQGKAGGLPSSSETTQAFQAHLVSQYYDAQERELDALSESFIGVPASRNNETIPAFQPSAYWVQRDEAEEMLFDELRDALFGKPQQLTGEGIEAQAELERLMAIEAQAYLVSQYYDAQEMELDALSESFIGVPAPWNNGTIPAFQPSAYWAQRDEAEEMMLQEVRQALIGKPVSSEQMKVFASVAELNALYPDTPYYRDPDWREGQMQSTGR